MTRSQRGHRCCTARGSLTPGFRSGPPTPPLFSHPSPGPGLAGPWPRPGGPGAGLCGWDHAHCQLPSGLCPLQANLTKSQNEFKIILKELEDSLLARLSAASGNFLGDTALVENLETTKHTASEIEEKVRRPRPLRAPPSAESPPDGFRGSQGSGQGAGPARPPRCPPAGLTRPSVGLQVLEAKITEVKINEARENYRPAAERASLLYFILNDLNKISPIYQFSLKVSGPRPAGAPSGGGRGAGRGAHHPLPRPSTWSSRRPSSGRRPPTRCASG